MLCSILIPTRFRLKGLRDALESFRIGACGQTNYEFIVRMHRDDEESLREIPSLLFDYHNLRIVIGSNLTGFTSVALFFDELCSIAWGEFVWLTSDYETVEGNWFQALSAAPKRSFIKPQTFRLNKSTYKNVADIGNVVIPNGCWKEFGMKNIHFPVDSPLHELLVTKNGWPVYFLPGVTGIHNRKMDRTLTEDRF